MKIVVVGARGMLGTDLCQFLAQRFEVLGWDIDEIDITNRQRTHDLISNEKPEAIINCAALVNIEACEAKPKTAWEINTTGAQNLALAATHIDADLVQISTDYIFDGKSDSDYDELAEQNPVNQYGRSKLAGEKVIQETCGRHYIVRTAWLFGHSPDNYVMRIVNAAEIDGVVQMPNDQLESPTYTYHLAEAISRLIDEGTYGIYNVTSAGACTRVDFAKYVLEEIGRSESVKVIDSSEIERTVKRPARAVLNCERFEHLTGHSLPHWQVGVREYLVKEKLLFRE